MNEEQPKTVAEIQQELKQIVKERKKLEKEGKLLPDESMKEKGVEMEMKRLGRDKILSIGEVMKQALPALEESGRKAAAFRRETMEKLYGMDSEFCEEHPEEEMKLDHDQSVGRSWKSGVLTRVLLPCQKCLDEKVLVNKRTAWLDRGIPRKVLGASFDKYIAKTNDQIKALKRIKKQTERKSGFVIAVGKVGTGKTHLAAAAMMEIGDGLFVTFHDLITELRATYEDGGQEKMIDKYRKTPCLVVDELSLDVYNPANKKSLDIPPLLYRVFGYRYDQDLLTIFTSNDTLEEVLSILGPKLRDRILTSYVVANFTWDSHRQNNPTFL